MKDFNPNKDVLVIPKKLDITKLSKEAYKTVRELESQDRVIRLDFIHTPAIVKSR